MFYGQCFATSRSAGSTTLCSIKPKVMTEYDVKFQEDMELLIDLFQHVNGFEMQEYTMSPPNCVAALLHL